MIDGNGCPPAVVKIDVGGDGWNRIIHLAVLSTQRVVEWPTSCRRDGRRDHGAIMLCKKVTSLHAQKCGLLEWTVSSIGYSLKVVITWHT